MKKRLPKAIKRRDSVTVNLNDPQIYKEYVKIASAFSKQVAKRIKEGRKRELKAENKVKDIIISY